MFRVYLKKQSPRCALWKKAVLRNFAKFTGKYLCQSLFFNKVAGFPVNFAKFLRTTFFAELLRWLLLYLHLNLKNSFVILWYLIQDHWNMIIDQLYDITKERKKNCCFPRKHILFDIYPCLHLNQGRFRKVKQFIYLILFVYYFKTVIIC